MQTITLSKQEHQALSDYIEKIADSYGIDDVVRIKISTDARQSIVRFTKVADIGDTLSDYAGKAWEGVKQIGQDIYEGAQNIGQAAKDVLSGNIWEDIKRIGGDTAEALQKIIPKYIGMGLWFPVVQGIMMATGVSIEDLAKWAYPYLQKGAQGINDAMQSDIGQMILSFIPATHFPRLITYIAKQIRG